MLLSLGLRDPEQLAHQIDNVLLLCFLLVGRQLEFGLPKIVLFATVKEH